MAIVIGAGVAAAGAVGSAVIGSDASSSAANQQSQSAQSATQLEQSMFNTTQGNLAPYMQAGLGANAALEGFLGLPGGNITPADAGLGVQQFQYNPASDPLYNFTLQQGSAAITNQASALGGVNSGATQLALQNYGQNTAQSSYQQEFNNYQTQLNSIFARLSGSANAGQNAAAGLGGIGASTAAQQGSNTIGAGNAQAAGTIGSANSVSSGLQALFNNPSLNSTLNGGSNTGLSLGQTIGANLSSDPIATANSEAGWTS